MTTCTCELFDSMRTFVYGNLGYFRCTVPLALSKEEIKWSVPFHENKLRFHVTAKAA